MYTLGDSIPPGREPEFGALAVSILDLLVLYDRAMYEFGFFVRDAGRLYRPLDVRALQQDLKGPDADKGKKFAKLAHGLGVEANWDRFKQAYRDVSGVRNWLAHVTDMTADRRASLATIAWTYTNSERDRLGVLGNKASVDSEFVRRRNVDAVWVLHHIAWARQQVGLRPGYFGWTDDPVSPPTMRPVY